MDIYVVFEKSSLDRMEVDSGYAPPLASWNRGEPDGSAAVVCVGSQKDCQQYIDREYNNADCGDAGPSSRRPNLELRVLSVHYSDTRPVESAKQP